MIYLVSSLITLLLAILEASLLPHFKLLGATPFLVLAFIVALSLKNKGTFHLVIAFFAGLFFDSISNGFPYTFLIVFVLTVLITRIFFYRDTTYDVKPTYLTTLTISTLAVYAFQIDTLVKVGFVGWQNFILTIISGVFLTLISGFVIFTLLGRYFDWLAKVSEEKFRG